MNVSFRSEIPINQVKKPKKYSRIPEITGYSAVALGLGSVAAVKSKKFSLHKNLAYGSGLMVLAHLASIIIPHARKNQAK